MSEIAAREMTAQEWAEKIAGLGVDQIAIALRAAEQRGERKGRSQLDGAVWHFETAYRYAVNASKCVAPCPDAADLLESAETFARIGYDEWRKAMPEHPNVHTMPIIGG